MRFTPYDHLTNEELAALVCHKDDVTDLELELMNRLERYMDEEIDAGDSADDEEAKLPDEVEGVPV